MIYLHVEKALSCIFMPEGQDGTIYHKQDLYQSKTK